MSTAATTHRRLRLDLAYDGTSFVGWARQRDARTVEGVLLAALDPVVPSPKLSVAGRTDTGVHAGGQVVSLTADRSLDPEVVLRSVNARLAPEVVVTSATWAKDDFDARRSATAREYRYRIATGPVADPFTARWTWHRPGALRAGLMRRAAGELVGHRDFAAMGKPPVPGATTMRDLQRITIVRDGDDFEITVRANAFLRHMVRGLVGTLVDVGRGRLEASDMPAILRSKDRGRAGEPAPPHGLTLERVIFGRS